VGKQVGFVITGLVHCQGWAAMDWGGAWANERSGVQIEGQDHVGCLVFVGGGRRWGVWVGGRMCLQFSRMFTALWFVRGEIGLLGL